MQYQYSQSSTGNHFTIAQAEPDARALLIRRTYGHLAGRGPPWRPGNAALQGPWRGIEAVSHSIEVFTPPIKPLVKSERGRA